MKFIITFCVLLSTHSAIGQTILDPKVNSKDKSSLQEIIINNISSEVYSNANVAVKKKKVKLPTLSPGQLLIKKMKERNRRKLQKIHAKKLEEEKNLENLTFLERMKNKEHKFLITSKQKVEETYKRWSKAKEKYLKNIDTYKENLVEFEEAPVSKDILKRMKLKLSSQVSENKIQLVSNAMSFKVANQGKRPTCSSFAAVRSMNILLAQNDIKDSLSEQYFYWSSKPKCQSSLCSNKGSWVEAGLKYSKNSTKADIPTADSCPYVPTPKSGNETQIPLKKSCSDGRFKVLSYKKMNSLDEVVDSLDNNRAVIGGFKLTPNFYNANAVISFKERFLGGSMDSHSAGHAILLVGYMKLPKTYSNEGKICFIAANSWGEGWGVGGHSCLTEKWVLSQRVRNPFISIDRMIF